MSRDVQARVLCRLAARLLAYPDEGWRADLEAIRGVLSHLPDSPEAQALAAFAACGRAEALGALQEEYVRTFDFAEDTTLHLTAHTFGTEKDRTVTPQRGYGLAQLAEAYAAHGLDLVDGELPDFLPVLLEFVAEAGCPQELARYLPVLMRSADGLCARLKERGSAFAGVVGAARSALAEAARRGGEAP